MRSKKVYNSNRYVAGWLQENGKTPAVVVAPQCIKDLSVLGKRLGENIGFGQVCVFEFETFKEASDLFHRLSHELTHTDYLSLVD